MGVLRQRLSVLILLILVFRIGVVILPIVIFIRVVGAELVFVFLILVHWRQIKFDRIYRDDLQLNTTLGTRDYLPYIFKLLVDGRLGFRAVAHGFTST